MEYQNRRKFFFALGLLWGLAGWASAGVHNPAPEAANSKLPKQIFVADYNAKNGGQPLRGGIKPKILAAR